MTTNDRIEQTARTALDSIGEADWTATTDDGSSWRICRNGQTIATLEAPAGENATDLGALAEFIAAAPPLISELIARIDSLNNQLRWYNDNSDLPEPVLRDAAEAARLDSLTDYIRTMLHTVDYTRNDTPHRRRSKKEQRADLIGMFRRALDVLDPNPLASTHGQQRQAAEADARSATVHTLCRVLGTVEPDDARRVLHRVLNTIDTVITRPGQGELDLRPHDLPPFWDDAPVAWNPWQIEEIVLCASEEPLFCDNCGSTRPRAATRGVRTITHTDDGPTVLRRALGTRQKERKVLTVTRCLDCLHDVVWDPWNDTWYDLDDSDYQDGGSHEPAAPHHPPVTT